MTMAHQPGGRTAHGPWRALGSPPSSSPDVQRPAPSRRRPDGRAGDPGPGESTEPSASASAAASVPDCGTEPVTLNIYHETISELMPQLSAEFTKQYPNVTFELKSDAFANATANLPRLLSGDNPPDISRAAQLIDLAQGRPAPEPRSLRDGVRLGCVAAGASSSPSASTTTSSAAAGRSSPGR